VEKLAVRFQEVAFVNKGLLAHVRFESWPLKKIAHPTILLPSSDGLRGTRASYFQIPGSD
jgi:hypothetical protein